MKEKKLQREMKIYIVLSEYQDMERHQDEYEECFIDEIQAYKYALEHSNDSSLKKYYVIEKEFMED